MLERRRFLLLKSDVSKLASNFATLCDSPVTKLPNTAQQCCLFQVHLESRNSLLSKLVQLSL